MLTFAFNAVKFNFYIFFPHNNVTFFGLEQQLKKKKPTPKIATLTKPLFPNTTLKHFIYHLNGSFCVTKSNKNLIYNK